MSMNIDSAPAGTIADIPPVRKIVSIPVHATTYADAAQRIVSWSYAQTARYVTVANVHVVMEAFDDERYRSIVADSSLVTPDGMPLVWALKALGVRQATRVYGPTLTEHVCVLAEQMAIPVGFYGGTPERLVCLRECLTVRYPHLKVAYAWPPPFRPLTRIEDDSVTREIRKSGARILFVGLGCPKQERWMAKHREHLTCTMVGVGAAFDFLSGAVRQAPSMLQDAGLEWIFRLCMEPRRLAARYLRHNPRFVLLLLRQLLRSNLAVRVLPVMCRGQRVDSAG